MIGQCRDEIFFIGYYHPNQDLTRYAIAVSSLCAKLAQLPIELHLCKFPLSDVVNRSNFTHPWLLDGILVPYRPHKMHLYAVHSLSWHKQCIYIDHLAYFLISHQEFSPLCASSLQVVEGEEGPNLRCPCSNKSTQEVKEVDFSMIITFLECFLI